MMKAVPAHNAILKFVDKENNKVSIANQHASFLKNPHSFAKNLLSPMDLGKPDFDKALADEYFPATYSNKRTEEKIQAHKDLQSPPSPKCPFDHSFPDFGFFSTMVKKKSNKSAAGINGNRYIIYKAAHSVRKILWRLLLFAWKNGLVASS